MNDFSYVNKIKNICINHHKQISNKHQYTNAYNLTYIKYNNHYLVAFRLSLYHKEFDIKNSDIGIKLFNTNFQEYDNNVLYLSLFSKYSNMHDISLEDPRLFIFKNSIYLLYNESEKCSSIKNRYLSLYSIKIDNNNNIELFNKLKLFCPDIHSFTEKNWSPFIYNDEFCFSYILQYQIVLL